MRKHQIRPSAYGGKSNADGSIRMQLCLVHVITFLHNMLIKTACLLFTKHKSQYLTPQLPALKEDIEILVEKVKTLVLPLDVFQNTRRQLHERIHSILYQESMNYVHRTYQDSSRSPT